ncbi:MAG: EamA family transporter, partial [Tissierellia bacterium]|nr:EamA family transporter [Tissierellia bacterium]
MFLKDISLSRKQAEILLAAVTLSRSISFVMTKIGLRELDRFTLLGYRFTLAFILLLPLAWRKLRGIDRKT